MELTFINLPSNINYSYSEERGTHIFDYKNGKYHIGVGLENGSPVISDNTPDELLEKLKFAFDKHIYNVEHGIEEEVDIKKLNT